MGEFIVIAALVGVVALVIRSMWRDHKKGATCSCGCDQCPGHDLCHPKK